MFCSYTIRPILPLLLLAMHMDFGSGNGLATSSIKKGRDTTNGTEMTMNATKASNVEGVTKKDICGPPKKDRPMVTTCGNGFYPYPSGTCNIPSSPSSVGLPIEHFNNATKKLSFSVTWEKPIYGMDSLWGYQVIYYSTSGGSWSKCFQINNKTVTHFKSDDSILFNREYRIIVLSLPRNCIDDKCGKREAGIRTKLKTLGKCEWLKKNGLKLPLECEKCDSFPKHGDNVPFSCRALNVSIEKKNCHNGKYGVTWDMLKLNISYQYLVAIELNGERRETISYNGKKTQNEVVLSGLRIKGRYTVTVYMCLRLTKNCTCVGSRDKLSKDHNCILSRPTDKVLSCKDLRVKITTPSTDSVADAQRPIWYILASSFFVTVAIGGYLYFRFRYRNTRRIPPTPAIPPIEPPNNNVNVPTVMLSYCDGCDRVKDFVLKFASVLNDNGIRVFVDLLESNLLAKIGQATYHEQRSDQSDYVIIVCTEDTDTSPFPCHTAFKFVLNIIRNNVMIEAKRSKYIPIYMEDSMKNVPSFLQSVALQFPNSFENIIQRLLGVRPYELTNSTSIGIAAVKNALQIDQTILNPLKSCISGILQDKHLECLSDLCSKGLTSSASVEHDVISVDCVSLQSHSSSVSGASQLDMSEPDDDSSLFEFQPGMENGIPQFDSQLSIV